MENIDFKKLLNKADLSKKEFSGLFGISQTTVNGWGTSGKSFPYWVESWLNNYIELKELKEGIKTREQYIDILHQRLEDNGIHLENHQKLSNIQEEHIKDLSVMTEDVIFERDELKKLIKRLIKEELKDD